MAKPFSQCSLADLADVLERAARTRPNPAVAQHLSSVASLFRNTPHSEAILKRHPLVRNENGLVCTGQPESRNAWLELLSEFLPDDDAQLCRLWIFVSIHDHAKVEAAAQVEAAAKSLNLQPHASSHPVGGGGGEHLVPRPPYSSGKDFCKYKSGCTYPQCSFHHFSPANNFEKPAGVSDHLFRPKQPCRDGLRCTQAGICTV